MRGGAEFDVEESTDSFPPSFTSIGAEVHESIVPERVDVFVRHSLNAFVITPRPSPSRRLNSSMALISLDR